MKINIAQHEFPYILNSEYFFVLSDYPRVSLWEMKKFFAFVAYEKRHGRETEIVCEDDIVLEAIERASAHPKTFKDVHPPAKITECTACKHGGCLTEFVCHTATIDNAKKILAGGRLLSAVKAFNRSGSELVADKRNAAGDPADYFDYIMFAWGNCQAGDRLVMERTLGRFPNEDDTSKNFSPGARFYIRYREIVGCPGYVDDGSHPAKVRDELVLDDHLYACVIPERHRIEFENFIQPELMGRVHFLPQNGLGIWDWSKTVYSYIENLSINGGRNEQFHDQTGAGK